MIFVSDIILPVPSIQRFELVCFYRVLTVLIIFIRREEVVEYISTDKQILSIIKEKKTSKSLSTVQ